MYENLLSLIEISEREKCSPIEALKIILSKDIKIYFYSSATITGDINKIQEEYKHLFTPYLPKPHPGLKTQDEINQMEDNFLKDALLSLHEMRNMNNHIFTLNYKEMLHPVNTEALYNSFILRRDTMIKSKTYGLFVKIYPGLNLVGFFDREINISKLLIKENELYPTLIEQSHSKNDDYWYTYKSDNGLTYQVSNDFKHIKTPACEIKDLNQTTSQILRSMFHLHYLNNGGDIQNKDIFICANVTAYENKLSNLLNKNPKLKSLIKSSNGKGAYRLDFPNLDIDITSLNN